MRRQVNFGDRVVVHRVAVVNAHIFCKPEDVESGIVVRLLLLLYYCNELSDTQICEPCIRAVESKVVVRPPYLGGNVTNFAPYKALELIMRRHVHLDERVVVHRVAFINSHIFCMPEDVQSGIEVRRPGAGPVGPVEVEESSSTFSLFEPTNLVNPGSFPQQN